MHDDLGRRLAELWARIEEARHRADSVVPGDPTALIEEVSVLLQDAWKAVEDSRHMASAPGRNGTEEAHRSAEERYFGLTEFSPVGIFGTDAAGCCSYVNTRWCEIAGLTPEESRGAGWADALHPDDRPRILASWQRAVQKEAPFQEEFRFVRADGMTTWVLGQGAPQRDNRGDVIGYTGAVTDITERKRAEDEIRTAKDAAELANDARNEFTAMVSHELKTPLNSILGYTELLLDAVEGPLNEDQRKSLARVQKSAAHLLRLVEDILDLSRMAADRRAFPVLLDVHSVPFRLRECVEDTAQVFTARVEAKQLGLTWLVEPRVPEVLTGDPDRLRQVLSNLIDNAVKFTDRGQIRVTVEREVPRIERAQRSCLHFAVRDTGIGIPEDKQAAVFKPFVQADCSTTRRHQGIGLGLAISLELVELMGGRIWVESRPGQGSTFHFTACFGVPPPGMGEPGKLGGKRWAQQALPLG